MTTTTPPQQAVDPKRLLTDREVQELRGLTPQFLKDDRRRGRNIPFVRLGRRVFYRLHDIDRVAERLSCGPNTNELLAARSPAGGAPAHNREQMRTES